jgi:hypothetical protein
MSRRYSIAIIASRGRYFAAGEEIPPDVVVAPFAEKFHRIVDDVQQPDDAKERSSLSSTQPAERDEAD